MALPSILVIQSRKVNFQGHLIFYTKSLLSLTQSHAGGSNQRCHAVGGGGGGLIQPGSWKTPPAVDMNFFYIPYLRYIYLKPPCKVSAP